MYYEHAYEKLINMNENYNILLLSSLGYKLYDADPHLLALIKMQ